MPIPGPSMSSILGTAVAALLALFVAPALAQPDPAAPLPAEAPDTTSLPAGAADDRAAPRPPDIAGAGAPRPGSLEGRVVLADATDVPLSGVVITIQRPAGALHAVTDAQGSFRIDALAPGTYEIWAELPGFATARATAAVQPGHTSMVTMALAAAETVEITDRYRSQAQLLRESADAVTVVETGHAGRAGADLGEVLARSQGVAVQRTGGLGSSARISLAGLQEDQIRFFVDGIPLQLTGFGLGIANVPVNLLDRVEIYRGVVPGRFGADALGGAINLVTDQSTERRASASYQLGSFGIHRATAMARILLGARIRLRAAVFRDRAQNNYPIDVEVPDARGRLMPVEVDRFHDDYRAAGGQLDLKLTVGPRLGQLTAGLFRTSYDKDLQHNLVMTVPYGEVRYGERALGGTVRWDAPHLLPGVGVSLLAAYSHRRLAFVDQSPWVYDWFGNRIRERSQPGERGGNAVDETTWEDGAMARASADIQMSSRQTLRATGSISAITRAGLDRLHTGSRDPLSAARDLLQLVTALEHQLNTWSDRVENILFVKDYVLATSSEEVLPGGSVQPLDRALHRMGVGNALRVRLHRDVWLKASYERATRLPRPDEIFGNGFTVKPNLALEPETSHNGNLGVGLDLRDLRAGSVRGELGLFLRQADQLIVLLGDDRAFTYQNVLASRAVGVEAALGWSAPGQLLDVEGSVTVQDQRNTSTGGIFAGFEGDRIPNRPWLLAAGSVRLQNPERADGLALWAEWTSRYVHEFFRGWESVGRRDSKQVVPPQLVHSVQVGAQVAGAPRVTAAVEAHNLTDARNYDFFGVQKPGRSFYLKLTAEY